MPCMIGSYAFLPDRSGARTSAAAALTLVGWAEACRLILLIPHITTHLGDNRLTSDQVLRTSSLSTARGCLVQGGPAGS